MKLNKYHKGMVNDLEAYGPWLPWDSTLYAPKELSPGAMVHVKYANGKDAIGPADCFDWTGTLVSKEHHIIAYQA